MRLRLWITLGMVALLALPAALPAQSSTEAMLSRGSTRYPWPLMGPASAFEPRLHLVKCLVACPSDGLMLVPYPSQYGDRVDRLGGPYENRLAVELDRNRLVDAGLPEYALRIHVFDERGDEVGAFWLGTRPTCAIPEFQQGPLSGVITADLGPRPISRPEALLVPVDFQEFIEAAQALQPECEELERRNTPPLLPTDPNQPVTAENPYV